MALLFFIPAFLLFFLTSPPGVVGLWTVNKVTIQTGGTITIPCHYDQKYKDNVKYWCRGYQWATCTVVARTSSPQRKGGVSITDDPAQQTFTVTMSDLQARDVNKYWCGITVGSYAMPDDKASLFLTVTAGPPGLSVESAAVAGEEGGSVGIRCLYGARHARSIKRFCRGGDWTSCLTAREAGKKQNSSVLISDDGGGAIDVTLTSLKRSDAGWYWCAVGDTQVPLHVSVTPRDAMSTLPTLMSSTTLSTLPTSTLPTTVSTLPTSTLPKTVSTLPTSTLPTTVSTLPTSTLPKTVSTLPTSMLSTSVSTIPTSVVPKTVSTETLLSRTVSTLRTLISSTRAPSSAQRDRNINADRTSLTMHRHLVWQSLLVACGILLICAVVITVTWRKWKQHKKERHYEEIEEMATSIPLEAESDWTGVSFLDTSS